MSVFYFTDSNGNYYELSATTRVSVTEPSRATTNPVESGKAITDNYVIEPRVVTFSGVITNLTVIGQDTSRVKSVDQWFNDIRQIRLNKEFVNVYVEDLNVIQNCLITSFDIDKTKEHGLSGWGCNFTMQEVLVSDRARQVDFPTPKDNVKDDVSGKRNSGNQATEGVDEELAETLSSGLIDEAVDLFREDG
jgi:hypothetical protein